MRCLRAASSAPACSRSGDKRARKRDAASAAARALFLSFLGSPSEPYGSARAPLLLASLENPTVPCALLNRFAARGSAAAYLAESAATAATVRRVRGLPPQLTALEWRAAGAAKFAPARADERGVLSAYHIDAGSLLAVAALDPAPGASVLDMCAAPGGKSLALAQMLGPAGRLVSNDVSPDRRRRLRDVLSLYLPRGRVADGGGTANDADADDAPAAPAVTIAGVDATRCGVLGSSAYDHVLLDAPCSSDRHMLRSPEKLAQWSPGCVRRNAARQAALLAVALDAVRPGGTVVYSTCALSRRENDDVVERTLARLPFAATIVPLRCAFGEPTPIGAWHVLPDTAEGRGPLYLCKLVRGERAADARGDYSSEALEDEGGEAAAAAAAARPAAASHRSSAKAVGSDSII